MEKTQMVLGSHLSSNPGLFAIKRWTMYMAMDKNYGYSIHQSNSYALRLYCRDQYSVTQWDYTTLANTFISH